MWLNFTGLLILKWEEVDVKCNAFKAEFNIINTTNTRCPSAALLDIIWYYSCIYLCKMDLHMHTPQTQSLITEILNRNCSSAWFFSQNQPRTLKLGKPVFLCYFRVSVSLSMSCPWKRKGQAQTAWERLTTGGSEQRYIKGQPICTAAYTHPHIHKHRLTYFGVAFSEVHHEWQKYYPIWQHVNNKKGQPSP